MCCAFRTVPCDSNLTCRRKQIRALYQKYGLRALISRQDLLLAGDTGSGAAAQCKAAERQGEGAAGGGDQGTQIALQDLMSPSSGNFVRIRPLSRCAFALESPTTRSRKFCRCLNGTLKDGDDVVTGAATAAAGPRPPGMGGRNTGEALSMVTASRPDLTEPAAKPSESSSFIPTTFISITSWAKRECTRCAA